MEAINLDAYSQYSNTYQASKSLETKEKIVPEISNSISEDNKIHNSAVDVSISMQSIKVFLNIKSVELSHKNTNAQNALVNRINNSEIYDFFSGKEIEGGLSLKSIGYEGKAITELSPDEAKELVSDDGFFGVEKTSLRVSSFVFSMASDNVEALEEARKGIIQGFEEAKKLWGGELPDISYETQAKTLEIIDEKIAQLYKTDLEKEVEEDIS